MEKRHKQPLTVQEQLEMDLMAEVELTRLQRQFRIMEGDRAAFYGDTTAKMYKQSRVLKVLKNESKELTEDLNVAGSDANRRNDFRVTMEIRKLLEVHNEHLENIKREKLNINEVDYQIKKVKKKILALSAKQVTEPVIQEKINEGQRTLEALENKLETCVKRFCTVLTENRKLREEINHMLLERTRFNHIWNSLLTNLCNGKKVMMDLIEQATIAYDQREDWCHKLQALKSRAHNDALAHMQQMREFLRRMHQDKKLQEFLITKGQRRVMQDLDIKMQLKRQEATEKTQMQLKEYKDTLAKIQEFVGEEDVDKLSMHFIKQEEENFALFNYVNELNHELESLADNIKFQHGNIDHQLEINSKRATQQKATLDSLRAQLDEARQEAKEKREALALEDHNLNKILGGISSLFKLLKCEDAPILNLLGETGTINNYNVLLYLGLLEERVTELIRNVYYKEQTEKSKKSKTNVLQMIASLKTFVPIQRKIRATPCPLCVEKETVSDFVSELQQVVTKEEIEHVLSLQGTKRNHVVHNVSRCHLPESRHIIQLRYA